MKLTVLLIAVAITLTACGTGEAFPTESDKPPDLVVVSGNEELTLSAHSYCWSRRDGNETLTVCADGVPADPLPSITVDDGDELSALFPLPWSLRALLQPDELTVDLDPSGSAPASLPAAGTYRADIDGRGEEGSAAWSFLLVIATSTT